MSVALRDRQAHRELNQNLASVIEDRLKRDESVAAHRFAEAIDNVVGAEQIFELAVLIVQCHLVEQDRLHQQVDLVGRRCGRCFHITTGAHVADLLMLVLRVLGCADQSRTQPWVVNQKE